MFHSVKSKDNHSNTKQIISNPFFLADCDNAQKFFAKKLYHSLKYFREKNIKNISAEDSVKEYLYQSMIHQMQINAGLSKKEEEVIDLFLYGLSFRQISEILGMPHQKISRLFNSAIDKMRIAYNTDPLSGWQKVYLAEINRK
ncbi:MAG: hypothetical protein SNJ70_07200 [Armatimonadota bacterium]